MKGLLQILAVSLVLFLGIAIAQEWRLFSSAWFGGGVERPSLSDDERRQVADVVYRALTVMAHLYSSDGDPRFAERLPASESVIAEIEEDLAYLRRNQRRQELELERLEILAVEPLGPERAEVLTREEWTIRTLWTETAVEAEPMRSQTLYRRYGLSRPWQRWRMDWWEAEQAGNFEEP